MNFRTRRKFEPVVSHLQHPPLSRREIVQKVLAHSQTGPVPYHVVFLGPLRQKVREYFGISDINRAVGNYLIWEIPPAEVGRIDLSDNEWLDEWGVRWKGGDLNRGYIVDHPLKEASLNGLKWPVSDIPEREAGISELCKQNADLFLLAWCGSLFERAHFLRGMENLMVDLYESSSFVHHLLDGCLEFCLGLVKMLGKYPVDAIILSDDYGQQKGALISRAHFREFFKPRLKTLFQAIHDANKKVALHSCGDISSFIPDLIEIGVEILHPMQPDTMDLHQIKREYGQQITLYGGISTQRLLRFGRPDEIINVVRHEKDILSKGGGFILAPSLDLTHDIPFENALAFLESATR